MTAWAEKELVQREVERLTASGFDVFVEPGPSLTPSFAEGYMPDVIAIGNGRKIAIEVTSRSEAKEKKLSQIVGLFNEQSEWEFKVVWLEPVGATAALPVQTDDQIRSAIDEVRKLRTDGHLRPAFLLAWATFEAVARTIAETSLERPQSSESVVRVLSQEGYLTPDQADVMRALAKTRNQLIHGSLGINLTDQDVKQLIDVLDLRAKS